MDAKKCDSTERATDKEGLPVIWQVLIVTLVVAVLLLLFKMIYS